MGARRAFTLIELLVVVGVVVALSAVALPYGTQMLDRQAYESAVDAVEAQAASARAYAQREGCAVELRVVEDGARIEARVVDLLALAAEDAGADAAPSADGMASALRGTRAAQAMAARMRDRVEAVAERVGASVDASGESGEPGAIAEPWARVELGSDARADLEAPVFDGAHAGAAALLARPEFAAASGPERIAIFLPDGSAAAARDLWVTAGGRAARLRIDPLLGEVSRSEP
ncbi:MAG: prepilin-type N-terminal cleavage/methylation domain-containing protein [Phycisphaerales bacterium]